MCPRCHTPFKFKYELEDHIALINGPGGCTKVENPANFSIKDAFGAAEVLR